MDWVGFVVFFYLFVLQVLNFIIVRFVWDEARYPTMSPLKEIVDGIHVQVAKIEDDLKVFINYRLYRLRYFSLSHVTCCKCLFS